MLGSVVSGEAIDDFKEAKQLFDQVRDIERQYEFNEITHEDYQLTRGGMEQRIASGLPPDRNPNFVPRS